MECNRDEAIRAKTIAEKKFANRDYTGAKKFALKAQTLNPVLDNISQMLITLDVYISSENKVNGESDWYKVLNINPSDDDETIRKQYRKLLLILHPDKNKSVGADGAFKIVSEAWSLLSDKTKRLEYSQRRNSSQSGNGVHNSVNKATSKPKSSGLNTFWTICLGCKMHYEYLRVYVNHTLLCPNCHKHFHAVEMAAPINIPKPGYSDHRRNHNSSNGGMYNSGASGVYWGPYSRTKVADGFYGQRPLKRRR